MKLKVTDWKHAWFESQISERFFQEMSRLEKGTVQGLETSAQWMEQIMIDVGALAQAMIRLEHEGATEPQVRHACDKAMRLAALSLQLITALDGADREALRSTSLVRPERADWSPPRTPPAQPAAPAKNTEAQAPKPVPAAPAGRPTSTADVLARNAALRNGVTRPDAGREAAREAARGALNAAEPPGVAPQAPSPGGASDAPQFGSLLQVSGRRIPRSESHLRGTILSLAEQGLSRAEIEVVTGEPRHIVEAVLNHGRSEKQAARQG